MENKEMTKKSMKKAIVSLSGGLDSTSLSLVLLSQGYEVRAYTFNYGQRNVIELKKAQKNVTLLKAERLPITFEIIDLTDVFKGSESFLISSGRDIPEGEYSFETAKSTVVPIRNVIFSSIIYSKAINWATTSDDDIVISLGIHGGDHHTYPDTRPESHEACRKAFEISDENSNKVDYIAPFKNIYKDDILKKGIDACVSLNIDWKKIYSNTISCYSPSQEGNSCGKCRACKQRLDAFEKLNLIDPIIYEKHTK